jgi:hypothetical protein
MHKAGSNEKEENYGGFIFPIFKILNDFIEKNKKMKTKEISR